ncbi:MAG: hypothetical protein Q7U72_13135 [Brevundimonas sp.]|uniref:hypothetical protein n=1 Tax=Brevundimonas sp. TaxID=1871086 RepID=UPI00271EE17C|nr:hypothetical protein [Brevundimonas sp.]MDO9078376.1 hypothetical protein [Brevundimonas sp.]MDP3370955.1 hypothetical protein [Brevundimonas sp.]MDZ4059577.1 hypothetical protein [Brevundimonas sp.]
MDYQPRIPVADDYLAALGRAAYNFTYLEWCVIWTAEDLSPGFLTEAAALTAGQIADRLTHFVHKLDAAHPAKGRLLPAAAAFKTQTVTRNQLLHSNPHTAAGGEQRLSYSGKAGRKDWPRADILAAAQEFELLAIEINDVFHGVIRAGKH